MAKRNLKKLILGIIPSDKSEEERDEIAREIMNNIGKSSLNAKVSQYDDRGNIGVFYDTKDARVFRGEIKDYLSRIPKKQRTPKKQETKRKRGRPRKTPEQHYQELASPPPNQITPQEACNHLEKKYKVSISQEDLKKIMEDTPLTRPSLDDAYKFCMFDLTPIASAGSNFKRYEVVINNQRGVPRYFCDRSAVLRSFLRKK